MKIFISWSGARSRAVAEIINDWIKCVLQAARPWLSTRDIDRGALWLSEINEQLKETAVGIVCLTHENKDRPWILFESGALAKGLSTNRVCTFLIDLQPADLDDPLAQFNHTIPTREGMWNLVHTLNSCLGINGLDERILPQVFETYWPQFEGKFKESLEKNQPSEKPKQRSEKDTLNQILEAVRSMGSRLGRIEISSANDSQEDHPKRPPVRSLESINHLKTAQTLKDAGAPPEIVMQHLLGHSATRSGAISIIARTFGTAAAAKLLEAETGG